MTREQFEESMSGIQLLSDGWLDGNAKAITNKAFDAAMQGVLYAFSNAPEGYPYVYPTPEGGVRLEWGGDGKDDTDITVLVRPDGTTVMDIIGMEMSYCSEGMCLIRNWYFRRNQ